MIIEFKDVHKNKRYLEILKFSLGRTKPNIELQEDSQLAVQDRVHF